MTKNIITMQGEVEFSDINLSKVVERMEWRIENINKRTKIHTITIRELEKQVKLLITKLGGKHGIKNK